MKQVLLVMAALCLLATGFAQTDSTAGKSDTSRTGQGSDTIRIGHIVIIKKHGAKSSESTTVTYSNKRTHKKSSNVSTNWFLVDLGFNNYTDNTNYSSAAAQQFAPGSSKDWFKLRNGKSVNVNIWLFMQRVNLVSHVVNLKYGFGLELNNYRYKENIVYTTSPTRVAMSQTIDYKKNKLATDYVTVPLMLDFNFTPNKSIDKSFGLSVGMSAGYMYTSRQKLKSSAQGKTKNRDDFDLRPYKLAYVGELKLGPIKLYGSMATQSMFENSLDQTPYAVGIRFSK
jgi:hypothetical protein